MAGDEFAKSSFGGFAVQADEGADEYAKAAFGGFGDQRFVAGPAFGEDSAEFVEVGFGKWFI